MTTGSRAVRSPSRHWPGRACSPPGTRRACTCGTTATATPCAWTVVLLVLCLAVYAVLLVAEAVRPRLSYDERRWATVFPLGMTAAATLSVATAVGVPWLRGPGRVLEWVAVAVWLLVAAGAVADAVRTARAEAAEGR
ncbi:SLAC1 family transporter [Streptomyces sp. F-1]|uniref:SLAC1 family transporter n=1 Tax=Streptomyces sp. F-1 TaxID=463642 RepID=UPI00086EE40F|nr:hypothetical protein STEPF1_04106 [Streptomyces sp. F-1]